MAQLRHEGTIRPVAPFDFDQALDFIGAFPPMHGEQVVSETSLKRAAWASQTPVAIKLSASGTVEEPELRYEFHTNDPLSEADTAALVRRVEIYLSVYDDLHVFYELIDSDPLFVTVKRELYGYHSGQVPHAVRERLLDDPAHRPRTSRSATGWPLRSR